MEYDLVDLPYLAGRRFASEGLIVHAVMDRVVAEVHLLHGECRTRPGAHPDGR
jgi:hypothetical protein